MDQLAFRHNRDGLGAGSCESRGAPRFTLLIRAAKLVSPQGEFVCVIRDISATGVSLRMFHRLPNCDRFHLELECGTNYQLRPVWTRGREAGFEFTDAVDVEKVVKEVGKFPKRGLRLAIHIPIIVTTLSLRDKATVLNLSQQGAKIEFDGLLAIDQSLRISGPGVGEIRAKVRWRNACEYGLVFDDTFSFDDFGQIAARLQCPSLLDGW